MTEDSKYDIMQIKKNKKNRDIVKRVYLAMRKRMV